MMEQIEKTVPACSDKKTVSVKELTYEFEQTYIKNKKRGNQAMIKLMKYLKKSAGYIVLIIALLFLQAYCDLSLPDYTSKIINVGIQQKGIEDSVPDKLRDSTMQSLRIFMDDDQKAEVSENYTLEDDTWVLNDDISKETRENLNDDFSKAMMMVAAFSGDSGFYSGAQSMKKALDEANEKGILKSETTILPGISSVSALAAHFGVSWNDAVLASIHGRRTNVVNLVRKNTKVFLLLSGKNDFEMLVNKFREAGINNVKISAGYRLSYPDERLFTFYLDEFETKLFDLPEGVYTCLIENEDCEEQILTPGMDDEIFSRTKVPMTKNEVRVLSISRLELTKKAVVYDVGSGTGSVSAECARLSPDIVVFAIEQKEEAANLTKENAARLGLSDQIVVINKKAPEGFEELPTPTHVFIGGSSGVLSDILSAIQKKLIVKENTKGKTDKASKGVRVVINAVSLETIAQITKLIQTYPVKHVQLTQIQASRAHKLGSYNLMQAQNPVLIASFNLLPDDKMEADE